MKIADLIFKNGTILTLDEQNTVAGSVAVNDGKIIGLWSEPEPPKELLTDKTEVIDLQGKTMIPGFIDTHNHLLGYAQVMNFVQCGPPLVKNIDDLLNKVSRKAKEKEEGEWIFGFGYDDTALEEARHVTRSEIDAAVPNHPVFISHISGHLGVANSKALELAGIDESIEDTEMGRFGRDSEGRLNGVLYEKDAISRVVQNREQASPEQLLESVGKAAEEYLSQGITTNTEAAIGMLNDPKGELELYLAASRKGINPMRAQLMVMHTAFEEEGPYAEFDAKKMDDYIKEHSGGRARLDSVKLFQDGSIQGYTGALREPYYARPEICGELFHKQDAFNEKILYFHKNGFRIAIHGNGDRAIGSILEGYEYALKKEPKQHHLHRIEHVQTATEEDIQKMSKLGVAGSFFINHVYYWGERHEKIFLGPNRAKRLDPLKDAVDANVLFTLHSDCPVTPISPLFSVWAAVNRLTDEGRILGPDQRIDVVTALKSMTIYGAKLNFQEDEIGSIETGKLADFAVLDQNPTVIDPIEIKNIHVLSTWIDGKKVYER
ncbi:amidohydrolase [Aciduricibacillus chroicocephali]|uniref:Amidohydrolase n=1 Tax=Aciduricibacillus chroicocephali TaxID=3054939 RepID=A0ABY9KVX6_9BACI|nr:amidohydrolase [Bacillaceae bacterium 44XB]